MRDLANEEGKMTAKHSITQKHTKFYSELFYYQLTFYVLGCNFHLDDAIKAILPVGSLYCITTFWHKTNYIVGRRRVQYV